MKSEIEVKREIEARRVLEAKRVTELMQAIKSTFVRYPTFDSTLESPHLTVFNS